MASVSQATARQLPPCEATAGRGCPSPGTRGRKEVQAAGQPHLGFFLPGKAWIALAHGALSPRGRGSRASATRGAQTGEEGSVGRVRQTTWPGRGQKVLLGPVWRTQGEVTKTAGRGCPTVGLPGSQEEREMISFCIENT